MLTEIERTLIENVVESLNRLYDGDSTVTDVHAVLIATAIALRGTPLDDSLKSTAALLDRVARSNMSKETKRGRALEMTDELRSLATTQLSLDSKLNPKQRHQPE